MMADMAIEKSPYEGVFDSLNGRAALGRVVDVDIANRRCRVKTLGLIGARGTGGRAVGTGTDDHDIPDVQWITTAASDGGAEDTSIPKIGQVGVLLYINHEPYLIGFFRTQNPPASTDPLADIVTQGDRLLSTIGGNTLILRAGGSIEVKSTDLCRTYWLPNNLISTVCQDWEHSTDGGFVQWVRDKTNNDTLLEFFIQDNQQPTNCVDIQLGNSDNGNTVELTMGAVSPDTFDFTTTKLFLSVDPNGTLTLNVGEGNKATLVIDAKTGDTTFTTQGNVSQQIQGNVSQTIRGNVTQNISGNSSATIGGKMSATVTGEVDVKTSADANVKASGTVDIEASKIKLNGESSGITTEDSHQGVIDFITGVPVLPSETVFSDI